MSYKEHSDYEVETNTIEGITGYRKTDRLLRRELGNLDQTPVEIVRRGQMLEVFQYLT